jgi:small ligand-binding sensory domain FIST
MNGTARVPPGDFHPQSARHDPASALALVRCTERVVQFHLRDARTSRKISRSYCAPQRSEMVPPPSGSLPFSCPGRGQFLYGELTTTARFRAYLGDIPLGGFFCNGESGRPRHPFLRIHQRVRAVPQQSRRPPERLP